MKCAWKELLGILPDWLAPDVDRFGKDSLQELRLRLGSPPELVCGDGIRRLQRSVAPDDLNFCINTASRYSPWAAQSIASGYLTAPGGHRIGICGEAVVKAGEMTGVRNVTSLCIRVARDFPGIGRDAAALSGSILLLGPPGSGKTTLLRDLVREISRTEQTAVVDERGELFPPQSHFESGCMLDVLTGCGKEMGIDQVLRTMGPSCIAVDEITAAADCDALLRAGWCGVRLIATAHAAGVGDLYRRPLYQPLVENRLFDHIIVLRRDKTWRVERVDAICCNGSVQY